MCISYMLLMVLFNRKKYLIKKNTTRIRAFSHLKSIQYKLAGIWKVLHFLLFFGHVQ